jgi:hypothetical protein
LEEGIEAKRKAEVRSVIRRAKAAKIEEAKLSKEEWEDVGEEVEVEQDIQLSAIARDNTEPTDAGRRSGQQRDTDR